MYFRKEAGFDHNPQSMILLSDTPMACIDMAAPRLKA
jgi:hypothetical protein